MIQKRMLKLAVPAGIAFALLLVASPAYANSCTLAAPYNGLFFVTTSNSLSNITMTNCTSVQQQDKVWDNFNFPSSLVGQVVQFNFATVNGKDIHSITLLAPLGTLATTTIWSYDISVIPTSSEVLQSVASDISQTFGTSTFTVNMTDNHGNPYSTSFTQVDTTVTGTTKATFKPGATKISVTDDSIDTSSGGSDATAAQNSFTQVLVPEPATLSLVGGGLISLGLLLRLRRERRSPPAKVS